MKQIYEATGKSVDEAIDKACSENGISLQEAEVEVVEFGSKGFLGFGGKDAKVRLIIETADNAKPPLKKEHIPPREGYKPAPSREFKEDRHKESRHVEVKEKPHHKPVPEPIIYEEGIIEEYQKQSLSFLSTVFAKLQVNPEHTATFKDGVLLLAFSGSNLGSIIGRRGETLNSLQYLTNLVINRKADQHIRIVLDVEGYRQDREETLIQLARKMAEKAVRTGRRVELEPMNPNERRVVHLALQDDRRVDSSSRGEEPYRRVVISAKGGRRR